MVVPEVVVLQAIEMIVKIVAKATLHNHLSVLVETCFKRSDAS